jgi:[acyl-carrier-protein] S-malonyltransferase
MSSFAFVFPGQGSQSVGMLDAWGDHPAVVETLKEASDAMGEDLGALIHHGPKEALGLTTNTQPVMLVSAIAAYRAWLAEGGAQPAVVAGHSLGEYSALVAAGVLTLAQAAPLVRFRAAAMQDAVAVGVGAMAAILGMDAAKVIEGCAQAKASFPSDSCEVLKAMGAKRALNLPVSAPFHSSLMKPAAEKLKEKLAATPFAVPQIQVVNNIDVAVETNADRIRDALYRQAFGPVRWVECVKAIKAQGVTMVLECGPGKVLAGMVKRIDTDMTGLPIFDPASLAEAKGALA